MSDASSGFERYLLSWELWYHDWFVDRISNPKHMKIQNSLTYAFWPPLWPDIHIASLTVFPKFQRKGIGERLVRHVQAIATDENVPVSLQASVVGEGLYLRCGFKIGHERQVDVLRDVFMVWEPEHLKGKWLEDIGDGRAKIIGA